MPDDARLDLDEARRILEGIARSGSDTARIQAIRTLLTLDDDQDAAQADPFEALDELAPRRRDRKAS